MSDAATVMTTATEPDGAPRVASLDILRGIAILGILFMNINAMGGAILIGWEDIWRYGHSRADEVAFFLRNTLADGTARCMLEMLFGVGMVILTDRAAKGVEALGEATRARRVVRWLFGPWTVMKSYYWRNFVLFLFGIVHVFILLWPGDILHTYGIAAMIAFLFRRCGPKLLLGLGLTAAILQLVGGGIGYVTATQTHAQVAAIEAKQQAGGTVTAADRKTLAEFAESNAAQAGDDADYAARMTAEDKARGATAGFSSWAAMQWEMFLWLESLFLEPLWIWEAAATMLVGAALFKWGVIQGARSTRFYLWLMLGCYAFGLGTRSVGALEEIAGHDGPSITWATMEFARLAVTLGHIAVVHLLLRTTAGLRLLKPFEAAGRTALTLYILQTIICLWIIYPPFGFGLYGKQGWMAWMLTAAAINALLLWGANWYVGRYRIAPVEWAWRSIIAGRRLAFSKAGRPSAGGATPMPA
ncbi:DUF418 domain-containing protein [Sphingomonas sp.]|uniref:DUF418 domain-containing protein n=1 Tax=Sphingomonas sp. TaxID=28214 RepID=UPI002DD6751E|nr:DUF418 domain-containing protein [Sphingomonas sp.]